MAAESSAQVGRALTNHIAGGGKKKDARSRRERLQDDLNQEIFNTTRLMLLQPRQQDAHHTYFALISISDKRAACNYVLRMPNAYFDENAYPYDFYMSQSMMFTYRALYVLTVPSEYRMFKATTLQKLPEQFRKSADQYFEKMRKRVTGVVGSHGLKLSVGHRTPKQMMLDACCTKASKKGKDKVRVGKVRATSRGCQGYLKLLNHDDSLRRMGMVQSTRIGADRVDCDKLVQTKRRPPARRISRRASRGASPK